MLQAQPVFKLSLSEPCGLHGCLVWAEGGGLAPSSPPHPCLTVWSPLFLMSGFPVKCCSGDVRRNGTRENPFPASDGRRGPSLEQLGTWGLQGLPHPTPPHHPHCSTQTSSPAGHRLPLSAFLHPFSASVQWHAWWRCL